MTNGELREKLALALEDMKAPMAEQGILWLVTLIPAVLFVLAIFVIGQYELSDEKIDELNAAVTKR